MVAQSSSSCPSKDSATTTLYIESGPKANTCTPTTIYTGDNYGIENFTFNTINNSSGYGQGYQNFTCTNSTTLTAGNIYPVSVTTSPYYDENVKIWIDYNNDGQFNSTNELVYTSNDSLGTTVGKIITPVTAVLNTPLRLRVMDESYYYTISGPCYNPYYGQAEDYTVIFIANTAPPICNFSANITTVLPGSTVNFTDLSQNVPTSWSWSFSGGTPLASTSQNPSVVYNTLGTYPVTLKVSNSFGADSLTKTSYIHVVSGLNMCSANTTNLSVGTLFDSGGPTGHYGNNENCSLLINPGCASSITLTFQSFNTYNYYDVFEVYDGNSAAGTLLLNASGTSLPNSVTATSGEMYIKWTSSSYSYFGSYQASWTSVLKTNQAPVAHFTSSTLTPPYNVPVAFTDNTTQYPDMWQWSFGDGASSTLQNPTHAYTTPGTKTVTLIATNCISSDTTHKVLTVQQSPVIQLSPDTLKATVSCNDSAALYLKIQNTGGGTLVSSITGNYSDSVNILVFTDSYNTTDYANLILAMQQYYHKFKITLFSGTTATTLQTALKNQNVLLFPAQDNYALFYFIGKYGSKFCQSGWYSNCYRLPL